MIFTVTLNPALDVEYTVDALEPDRVLRAQAVRTDFGGKGFNVSRALLALGGESTAIGLLSRATASRFKAALDQPGLRVDAVETSDETRTNVSLVAKNGGPSFKVNAPGSRVGGHEWEAVQARVSSYAKAGDVWILSGSLPPGLPDSAWAELVARVKSAGAFAFLDTSGAALALGLTANPELIKPNASEAAELTGLRVCAPFEEPADGGAAKAPTADWISGAQALVARLRGLGARDLLLTFGKEGALFVQGTRAWYAKAPAILEQNATGAGDASLAGLAWGLQNGKGGAGALRLAAACGAAAASLPGTGLGSLSMVEALSAKVEVGECWA